MPGFYDPAVYARGRELTIVGMLQTPVVGKIGEYDYRYPRLVAETVYLWPEREVHLRYDDPYWYGYWGYDDRFYAPHLGFHFGPYHRPWVDPFWYSEGGRWHGVRCRSR